MMEEKLYSQGLSAGRRCMVPRAGKLSPCKTRLKDEPRVWVPEPPSIPALHPNLQHLVPGQSWRILHLTPTAAALKFPLQRETEAEGPRLTGLAGESRT